MKSAYFVPALALAAALAALASGLGYRLGVWNLGTAFSLLRAAAVAAAAGALLSLFTAALALRFGRRGLLAASLAGLVAGTLALGIPGNLLRQARGLPAIHDVTTDTVHPPEFVALARERLASPNGLEYGGRHVAEAQRESYPDIRPLTYGARAPVAFERSLQAARRLGWQIAAADSQALRIEATDRTLFFGFRDDVVIRIAPLDEGRASRIDVRSASRVGGADFGANARRVRRYLRELAAGE